MDSKASLLILSKPFPGDQFKTLSNGKSLQATILNLKKMAESFPKG